MTVSLVEGFDHVQDVALKNWANSNGIGAGGEDRTVLQTGRLNGYCLRIWSFCNIGIGAGFTRVNRYKIFPSTSNQVVLGFALKPVTMRQYAAGEWDPTGIMLTDSSNNIIAYLELNATNNFDIKNSGGATVATSTAVATPGVWHYWEWRVKVNGASGECELRCDGGPDVVTTTGNFGSTALGGVRFQAWAAGYGEDCNFDVDDIYVVDMNSGSTPGNDFLGDCRVETVVPAASGNTTQMTANTGPNWSAVDELSGTFPDGDISYVSEVSAGKKDTYQMTDLVSTSGTVYAVQVNLHARKTTAGTKQIQHVVRQGSTDYDGSTTHTLSTSYLTYSQIMELDPTSAAWNISKVNGDEFGVKIVT